MIPESGRFLWRREWLPIPVFLPGESHGQRSLAGYSPWGSKESDMTERLTFHTTLEMKTSLFDTSFINMHLLNNYFMQIENKVLKH